MWPGLKAHIKSATTEGSEAFQGKGQGQKKSEQSVTPGTGTHESDCFSKEKM